MVIRYGSHDIEDIPATQDSPPLDLTPTEHPMLEEDNELSDEYCEQTDTCHPLAEILEKFCQIKDQFISLKSTTPESTPTAELSQLTDKLQHLTMMLQPVHTPSEDHCRNPCRHTQKPCAQHTVNQTPI